MESVLSFEDYQKGLAENKLLGLYCEQCGQTTVPPQMACNGCGKTGLAAREVEQKGTIQTYTVIRVAPEGMEPPYIVAIVELECGASVIGNLLGQDPDQATMELIGQSVTVSARQNMADRYAMGDLYSLTFELA